MTPSVELESLDPANSRALLRSAPVGRLVFTERALPAIRPVNFTIYHGSVLIRLTENSELQRLDGTIVAFEADEIDRVTQIGWSVVVLGRAELVTDLRELVLLGESAAWRGTGDRCLRVQIDQITGYRLTLLTPIDQAG
ncbi:pyridoxamine 5'-phosphate oxidase family protein [Amycolatopsis anabasis]|uniref:pyridoxamine 5'-phosphate oxidase family protein n=1 Tax=Amycolatopsis anabasis TaxID=1840409 RepID=UPI00131AEF3B|nr:pyridoxamine 5'-phosphate oxidase family protein [Amycolatopsis anabasis]